MTVKELAPAKINLYLDVLGKRDDGFHDIETLMQEVTLSDDVIIDYEAGRESGVTLKISGNDELPADESNLVIRAYRAFTDIHPLNGVVHIILNKRIPTAAGLGGGSADAAATLRALNKIAGHPISRETLLKIAESLGSDVPFCLIGGRAICHGRGEKILPLKNEDELHVLIAKTDENVSTPIAYSVLDKQYADFKDERKNDGRKAILTDLKNGNYNRLYNIFDEPVLCQCPKAKKVKETMLSLGASVALMSGSGPSVFGIFESAEALEKAREIIENDFCEARLFAAKTV
jgi:4-diphosphocytidyl-2-C-methyl-D-erythritol kinase